MKKTISLFSKSLLAAAFLAFFFTQKMAAQAGAALHFDGSNDYVTFPTTGMTAAAGTISFWVNAAASQPVNSTSMVEFNGDNTSIFFWNNGTQIYFRAGGIGSQSSPISYTGGSWKHVAMTWAGVGQTAKCYINGDPVASFTQTGSVSFGSTGYLGRSSSYANGLTNLLGSLDDVRFWNRMLCADEILALKDCEASPSSDDLSVYFKCNQGTAGGDNTGETVLTDDATGIGGANDGSFFHFALDGSTSNFVAPGGVTGGACSATFPQINVQGAGMNNILDGDNTPQTSDGTDHGSVLVGSPSTKTFTIQNTGAGLLTVSSITLTGANANNFSIQNAPATVAAGGSATFDVVFMTSSAGLKSATVHVNNDDCDEADYDFAVQGTGAAAAKGLHFDGTNDYVDVTSSANMPFGGDFTVEAWVYPQSTSEPFPTIFSKNGDQLVMWFHTGAGNTVAARVAGAQLDGAALPLNTWSHVALTRLGTTARLYLNGVLQDTETTGTPSTGSSPFNIGVWTGNGRFFKGSIDEMRVWGAARTAAEILASKDAEIAQMPNCLIQYYKFNQGTVGSDNSGQTTLTDIADATAENGTLNNFALTGTTSNWASGAAINENASTYLTNFPDINLVANGNNITDGTSTPSAANNTALGSVLNGAGKSRLFTIENLGNENLTVSTITFSGTNAADFSVSGISLPLVLAQNASQTFTVTCNPSTAGAKTATINIVNNDCDEGNYDFAFSATGTTAFTFSSGSDWATAANWDVEIVPTTANLTSPRSVVIAQNCTMNSIGVTFSSGTSLNVNSSKSLSLGTTSGITINSGATLTVQSTGSISQGFIDNYGTMDISGSYTAFYMTNRGSATLNVLSGGSYSCPACAETMLDASIINVSGTMHAGTGSTWQSDLTINSGGTITDGGNGAQITLGANSTTTNNGSFVSRTAKTAGVFVNNGTLSMPLTCNFTVQSGGVFTNNGILNIPTGTAFTVNSGGELKNESAGTLTNNGSFVVNGAFSQNGTYKGSGSFSGAAFSNGASGSVAPGNSAGCASFSNDFSTLGTTAIELGGTTVCTQHDRIIVTGTATLGGTLNVSLINSYTGASGHTATILTATTAISGTFSTVNLPPNWFINYGANAVILSYGAVLPVELTFFEAKSEAERVRLFWQTASETNNRGFEIERSSDGFSWQNIGFENGKGTTTERSDYLFLDQKPLAGQSFYRLRQVDFDGKSEFSNIVSIQRKSEKGLTVAPNPAPSDGFFTILFDKKKESETVVARLFDATGRLVKSQILSDENGSKITTDGLGAGLFWLEVEADGELFFEKILVR